MVCPGFAVSGGGENEASESLQMDYESNHRCRNCSRRSIRHSIRRGADSSDVCAWGRACTGWRCIRCHYGSMPVLRAFAGYARLQDGLLPALRGKAGVVNGQQSQSPDAFCPGFLVHATTRDISAITRQSQSPDAFVRAYGFARERGKRFSFASFSFPQKEKEEEVRIHTSWRCSP